MGVDDAPDDGKPQTGSMDFPGIAVLDPVESGEDLLQVLFRDAETGIPDGDRNVVVFEGRREGNPAVSPANI